MHPLRRNHGDGNDNTADFKPVDFHENRCDMFPSATALCTLYSLDIRQYGKSYRRQFRSQLSDMTRDYTRRTATFWLRHDRIDTMFLRLVWCAADMFTCLIIDISVSNIAPMILPVRLGVMLQWSILIKVMLWFA